MTLNRRSFLVGGAASAAASISTFAHAANPCSTPTTWDKTYDVIVIGSGGAGLSAGIVAKKKAQMLSFWKNFPFQAAILWLAEAA